MLVIYGYSTFNPFKVVASAEELGVEYEYRYVDLGKRENMSPDFAVRNPFGKVPVLEHNGHCITESATICRYLARINDDRLYSKDLLEAAEIDSVMDLMNVHIGRWMSVYFWEEVIRPKFFREEPDREKLAEAKAFLDKQLPGIEKRLENSSFLCGDGITIADTFAVAYFMIKEQTSIDISDFPQTRRWYDEMMQRPAIVEAREVVFGSVRTGNQAGEMA